MKKRLLVLGDMIRDTYSFVSSSRNAQEAPIPIWDVVNVVHRLGGMGNVVNNISSICSGEIEIWVCGLIDDKTSELLDDLDVNTLMCLRVPHESAIVKTRFVDGDSKYLARVDNRKRFFNQDLLFLNSHIKDLSSRVKFDGLVVSDYDKGTVDKRILETINDHLISSSVKIVDSKRKDLNIYKGFDVLKLNLGEYSAQVSFSSHPLESIFKYVIVTRGKSSTQLNQYGGLSSKKSSYIIHTEDFPVPVMNEKMNDVTGCGDTHTAALACSLLLNGNDVRSAVRFANECASSVVSSFGTSCCKMRLSRDIMEVQS
jgi:D-beta-D-heptose 7-phosphate kinase/D-beta-D-heptose 1-phosphate adenosyltransferase